MIQIAVMTIIIDLGCNAFTVCNLNLPFARDVKPTNITSFFSPFFFFAAALKILQQNASRRNTDTSDNLPQRLQALCWSSDFSEVPS